MSSSCGMQSVRRHSWINTVVAVFYRNGNYQKQGSSDGHRKRRRMNRICFHCHRISLDESCRDPGSKCQGRCFFLRLLSIRCPSIPPQSVGGMPLLLEVSVEGACGEAETLRALFSLLPESPFPCYAWFLRDAYVMSKWWNYYGI